jgi:hypothetical protein
MDRKTINATVGQGPLRAVQIQAASHKAFSRESDEAPCPHYVNNVEFTASGMDVFMDAGTVAPEAIRDAMEGKAGDPPSVKFNVDFRFGMSLQTALLLHQRLGALLQASARQLQPRPVADRTETDTQGQER